MSCTHLHILRRLDGSLLVRTGRVGWLPLGSPEEVHDCLLDFLEHDLTPVSNPGAWTVHSGDCEGVLLDLPARVFRGYRCYSSSARSHHTEACNRLLRAAPAWRGWDAQIAIGGPFELAHLAGLGVWGDVPGLTPPPLVQFPGAVAQPLTQDWAWDKRAWSISCSETERSDDSWDETTDLLTLVGADDRSFDFRLRDLWAWLLHGPVLIEQLSVCWPVEPCSELRTHAGALIELGRRTLRWWGGPVLPVGYNRALEAAWAGWTVEPEPDLYLGQLARAGRDASPLRLESKGGLSNQLSADLWALLGRPGPGPAIWPRQALRFECRERGRAQAKKDP